MRSQSRHTALARLVAGSAVAMLLVAACSGSSATQAPAGATEAPAGATTAPAAVEDPNATDSGGQIMVWVDAPRVPAAEAFQKAYPDIPIEINAIAGNVGSTDLQQKFALFNQAGNGLAGRDLLPVQRRHRLGHERQDQLRPGPDSRCSRTT